jgi:hypothetical protein
MSKSSPGRSKSVTLFGVTYITITAALIALQDRLTDPVLTGKPRGGQVKTISERCLSNWSDEEAFGFLPPPPHAQKGYARGVECSGHKYNSIAELAGAYNLSPKVIYQRMGREGWPAEAAVNLVPPPPNVESLRNLTGCIYCITHQASGRAYIGLSIDSPRRMWRHLSDAKKRCAPVGTLHHAITRFGAAAFDLRILEENIPAYYLPVRERHWISHLGTLRPNGYNQNQGGVFGAYAAPITIAGIEYIGVTHAAAHFNMSPSKFVRRRNLGWSHEENVGLVPRETKTRTKITLDLGGDEPTVFPSAAAACRMMKLPRGPLARLRARSNRTWQDIISEMWFAKLKRDEVESPISLVGGARRS